MLPEHIRREAKRRETVRRNQSAKIRDDSHSIGFEGEYAFSKWSGIPMDLARKDHGDGGRDFPWKTSLGTFTINVKTTTLRNVGLLVESKDLKDWTIYVGASFIGGKTTLLGWQWGKFLKYTAERGDFYRKGKDNYRLRPHQLRDMIDLMLAKI